MPQLNPNEARNSDLVNFYTKQLHNLCVDLYAKRCDILLACYGDVFDNRPDCMLIIGMPPGPPYVAPTTRMVYLEAKFVLDSDESESATLDTTWSLLHRLIAEDGNRMYLQALETLNHDVRRRIIECKHVVMDSMPAFFKMLEDDCYVMAFQHAESVYAWVKQTFDEIIRSYSFLSLSSD